MYHEAAVKEFPFVENLPKLEKTRIQRVWEHFQQVRQISQTEGIPIPQHFVAKLLGLSQARVTQLVQSGQLKAVRVGEQRMVTENSLVDWARSEHKAGRPTRLHQIEPGVTGAALEAFEIAKAYKRKK